MGQYITLFTIIGKSENIIRLLNAALHNIGSDQVIEEGDDLDVMNSKLMGDDEKGIQIGIPDLLDEEHLKEEGLQVQKRQYEERIQTEDDEYLCKGRWISFVRVEISKEGYVAKFSLYEYEDYRYQDWVNWQDIVRLYDCRVIADVDGYWNGQFDGACRTAIYEMVEGSVKETCLVPELEYQKYIETLDTLCKMNPKRYRERKIQSMEAKVSALQAEISREKLLSLLEQLDETKGRLVVPDGVTELSDVLCPYAYKLRSIYIPASVDTINKHAISSSNLESIEISPDNPNFCSENNCILDKDKTRLLIGCKGSAIPEGITEIENSAFSGCRGLEKITIPSHVKKVGNDAFSYCTGLSELTIEDGVEKLGWASFMGCTSLFKVVLPESLDFISDGAFEDCTSLTNVTLPIQFENRKNDIFSKSPEIDEDAIIRELREEGLLP